MSLINQMLQDLEARSAPQLDEHADAIKGVTWTTSTGRTNKRRYVVATLIASILCTGIAVAGYYHLNSDTRLAEASADSASNVVTTSTASAVSKEVAAYVRQAPVQQLVRADEIEAKTNAEANKEKNSKDSEARKMLAALVAKGALAEPKKMATKRPSLAKQKPIRPAPIQLAERESIAPSENKVTVQKKLRPLGKKKLAEIAYQEGYEFIASGQQAAAENKLLHALDLLATHSKAREMLAVLYLQQQRLAEASQVLTEGMKLLPGHLPFREIYARILMAKNQLPQAITMLNQDAPNLDQQPNYHALLAGLYQQNQQHEQAAATYLKLIKHNPQQSQWWLGMAISLEKLHKNAEAISAYKKARELKLPARLMKYVDSRLQYLDASHAASQ